MEKFDVIVPFLLGMGTLAALLIVWGLVGVVSWWEEHR